MHGVLMIMLHLKLVGVIVLLRMGDFLHLVQGLFTKANRAGEHSTRDI